MLARWLQVDLLFGNEIEEAAQVFRDVPKVEAVIPVAATTGHNVKAVEDWAVSHLPLGPALYPKVHLGQPLSTGLHAHCTLYQHVQGHDFGACQQEVPLADVLTVDDSQCLRHIILFI